MSNDVGIRTATMAGIYRQQGYLDKAAGIYRFLLEKEPDRIEFKTALTEIEQQLGPKAQKTMQDVEPLLREWMDLLFTYNKLQKLKKLRR